MTAKSNIRALTLHQPWAHVVASGVKLIENRPWLPPAGLHGKIFAIHAGMTYNKPDAWTLGELTNESDPPIPERNELVFGAVIAMARLRCVTFSKDEARYLLGDNQARWWFGPYGWVLQDIVRLPRPVPCRGYQKLWRLSQEDLVAVMEQLNDAREEAAFDAT